MARITVIRPQDLGINAGRQSNIGEGFENLAHSLAGTMLQKKFENQQQKERQTSFDQLIAGGFQPDIANLIVSQRPEDRIKALELFGAGKQEMSSGNQNMLQNLGQSQPQKSLQDLLGAQNGQPQDAVMQNLLKILAPQQQQTQPSPIQQQIKPQLQQQEALTAAQALSQYEKPQEKQGRLKREQQERQFQQKEAREQRKLSHVEQREVDKETLPVFNEINKDAKAAKSNDLRLDRMQHLVKEGKLVGSKFASYIQGLEKIPVLGGAASSILKAFIYSPESLEFEKLTFDFLKDAKSVFGSRLTNFDVESFLKTVPTLALSPEGKLRVIHNLKLFNEAAEEKQKALREVIKQNGGKRPRDLEERIEQKASPALDKIAEKFKRGYISPTV